MTRSFYGLGHRALADEQEDGSLLEEPDEQVDRAWQVELVASQACWYDLAFNPPPDTYTGDMPEQALRSLQAALAPQPDDREIRRYALAAWGWRPQVRFCVRKKPHYALMGGEFIFHVEIGASRARRRLATTFVDVQTGMPVRPEIELDERFISIALPDEAPEIVTIYDFLHKCGLELGMGTQIHAIACVPDLSAAWLDTGSTPLADMLYRVPSEANDFFYYGHVLCATPCFDEKDNPMITREVAPGSVTGGLAAVSDALWRLRPEPMHESVSALGGIGSKGIGMLEIDSSRPGEAALQGKALAHAVSAYFGLDPWEVDASKRLVRKVLSGTAAYGGGAPCTMHVAFEHQPPHELYRLGSTKVSAKDRHVFSCVLEDGLARVIATSR